MEEGNLSSCKQEPLNHSLAAQNGEQVHSRWLNMDALNLIGPAPHTSVHQTRTHRVPAISTWAGRKRARLIHRQRSRRNGRVMHTKDGMDIRSTVLRSFMIDVFGKENKWASRLKTLRTQTWWVTVGWMSTYSVYNAVFSDFSDWNLNNVNYNVTEKEATG